MFHWCVIHSRESTGVIDHNAKLLHSSEVSRNQAPGVVYVYSGVTIKEIFLKVCALKKLNGTKKP